MRFNPEIEKENTEEADNKENKKCTKWSWKEKRRNEVKYEKLKHGV